MLYGHREFQPDTLPDPTDIPLDTTEPPQTKARSKHSTDVQTTLYGIFQLSDIACDSGSSQSQNLCELNCSGEHTYTIQLPSMKNIHTQVMCNLQVYTLLGKKWFLGLFL